MREVRGLPGWVGNPELQTETEKRDLEEQRKGDRRKRANRLFPGRVRDKKGEDKKEIGGVLRVQCTEGNVE